MRKTRHQGRKFKETLDSSNTLKWELRHFDAASDYDADSLLEKVLGARRGAAHRAAAAHAHCARTAKSVLDLDAAARAAERERVPLRERRLFDAPPLASALADAAAALQLLEAEARCVCVCVCVCFVFCLLSFAFPCALCALCALRAL